MDRNESIVAKGFLVKYNLMLSPFPRWFIIFTLGFCGFIKSIRRILALLSFSSSMEPRSQVFDIIRYGIYVAILLSRCVIVTFGLDWKAFAAYIEQLSRLELEKDVESVKQIKRERKLKNWFCFVSLLSYMMIMLTSPVNRRRSGIDLICETFVDLILLIAHFSLVHLIIDLCICLNVAFQYVNHHLANFQINSADPMLSELRSNRLFYSCTIRASQEAEKFARHFIAWFYCQFILFNIVNIVDILGPNVETGVTYGLFMVLDIINLAYLTVKLVAVNKASTQGMEDLYEISYGLKSYSLQNENNLFLNRMLWQNVGFTFSDLFLINPNFITSLLSFVLTIALMIANFLYK
uniref:Gustatory receptor n=1 Tax=Tetranychus urticae TaxID=32264 RepID=T1KAD4_TETUR